MLAYIDGGLPDFLVLGFIYGRHVDSDACCGPAETTVLIDVHTGLSTLELVRVIRPRSPRFQSYYEGCRGHTELCGSVLCTHVLKPEVFPHRAEFFVFIFCAFHFSRCN